LAVLMPALVLAPASAAAPTVCLLLVRPQAGRRGAEAGPGALQAFRWQQAARTAPLASGKGSPARCMPFDTALAAP